MLASVESRARRTAFEIGFVADHLHLQVRRRWLRADDDGGRAHRARGAAARRPARCPASREQDRAMRLAGRFAVLGARSGLSTSPQKRPIASCASTPSSLAACGFR
jgi:hypothetical protein